MYHKPSSLWKKYAPIDILCGGLAPYLQATDLTFKWTAELATPKPYQAEALQGETVDLVVKAVQYGQPFTAIARNAPLPLPPCKTPLGHLSKGLLTSFCVSPDNDFNNAPMRLHFARSETIKPGG
ncbi:MAG: hypothetical protein ACI4RT_07120 [Candidatus Spyradenecus sp.]